MKTPTLFEVPLPYLGEGIEEAELALWHVKKGDFVASGDDLCEVVTDKVSFYVAAPEAGVIKTKCAQEEDVIKIGAPLVYMDLNKE